MLNRLYEPAASQRDATVVSALEKSGTEIKAFNASLLFEPGAILNGEGAPYRVFTPFWRAAQRELSRVAPTARSPRELGGGGKVPSSLAIADLHLLPRIAWDAGAALHPPLGARACTPA